MTYFESISAFVIDKSSIDNVLRSSFRLCSDKGENLEIVYVTQKVVLWPVHIDIFEYNSDMCRSGEMSKILPRETDRNGRVFMLFLWFRRTCMGGKIFGFAGRLQQWWFLAFRDAFAAFGWVTAPQRWRHRHGLQRKGREAQEKEGQCLLDCIVTLQNRFLFHTVSLLLNNACPIYGTVTRTRNS